jgi:hypothetical protein
VSSVADSASVEISSPHFEMLSELDGDYWFKGVVDEVAIFNLVLSPDDVETVMAGLENLLAVSSAGKLATTLSAIKAE